MFTRDRRLTDQLNTVEYAVMPTLSRLTFARVLLLYFWNSGMIKLGDWLFGFFTPRSGTYAQIFPKAFEVIGYDITQLTVFHWAVVTSGTIAEFVLPLQIVVGLLTRLSSMAMIVFIVVKSLTDKYGHGGNLGAWFNKVSSELITDQRAFWIFVLLLLVFKGAGPVSLDRFFKRTP